MQTARELANISTILDDMVDDLEGNLAAIAFMGDHNDLEGIRQRIDEFKKVYGLFMEGGSLPYGLNPVHDAINEAYDEFEILDCWEDSHYIRERAEYAFSCLNSPMDFELDADWMAEKYPHLKPWLEKDKKKDEDVGYYSEI